MPKDTKSGVLLEGRLREDDTDLLLVRPGDVMAELLATVVAVRQYVLAAVLLVGATTVVTIMLVFVLSVRLRRGEIQTMARIGAPPMRVAMILGCEILLVLLISACLAAVLTALAANIGENIFRAFLFAA